MNTFLTFIKLIIRKLMNVNIVELELLFVVPNKSNSSKGLRCVD